MEILKKKVFRFCLKLFIIIAGLFFLVIIGRNLAHVVFPVKDNIVVKITEGEIGRGESLYSALVKDFSAPQVITLGRRMDEVYSTQRVKPGHQYKIYHSTFGKILKFEYRPEPLKSYVLTSTGTNFTAKEVVPDFSVEKVAVKGSIRNNLYCSMVESGVDVKTIMSFADIFQWQVDFFTEVRSDDRFLLVFERYYVDGEPVETGNIITASYRGHFGNHTAIRFEDGNRADYYDADGNSLRKQFLKAPLSFTRISSRFNPNRKHPILRIVRPHLAIDYAAPSGTPISSVASGKVIYAGWKGGYGRTVMVRHNSIYTTQYGHMRAYGPGIRAGKYINQGDIVGYVGTSGLSTGPHLDFKITKNGRPVNFLSLKFPPASSVSKENKSRFEKKVEQARAYLDILRSDIFAGEPVLLSEAENEL
ncbi:MAG: peptidoglycan DD-metalloendopeptidase family protein [Elusimicrobiota bacterium]|nr:peptidoglycan DD-metalloendopeptidase family protein [Elusimicrobiota bacterium]